MGKKREEGKKPKTNKKKERLAEDAILSSQPPGFSEFQTAETRSKGHVGVSSEQSRSLSDENRAEEKKFSSDESQDPAMIDNGPVDQPDGFSHARNLMQAMEKNYNDLNKKERQIIDKLAEVNDNQAAKPPRRKPLIMGEHVREEELLEEELLMKKRQEALDLLNQEVVAPENRPGLAVRRHPCFGFNDTYPMTGQTISFNVMQRDMRMGAERLGDFDETSRGKAERLLLSTVGRMAEIVCTPKDKKEIEAAKKKKEKMEKEREKAEAKRGKEEEKKKKKRAAQKKKAAAKKKKKQAEKQKAAQKKQKKGKKEKKESEYSSCSDEEDVPLPDEKEKEALDKMFVSDDEADEAEAENSSALSDEEADEACAAAEALKRQASSNVKGRKTRNSPKKKSKSNAPVVDISVYINARKAAGQEVNEDDFELNLSSSSSEASSEASFDGSEDDGCDMDIDDDDVPVEVAKDKAPQDAWTFFLPAADSPTNQDAWVPRMSFVAEVLLNRRWREIGMRYTLIGHDPELDLNELLNRVIQENKMLKAEQDKKNMKNARPKKHYNPKDHTCVREMTSAEHFYRMVLAPLGRATTEEIEEAVAGGLALNDMANKLRPTHVLSFGKACRFDQRIADQDVKNEQCMPRDYMTEVDMEREEENADEVGETMNVRIFQLPAATFMVPLEQAGARALMMRSKFASPALTNAKENHRPDGSRVHQVQNQEEDEENFFAELFDEGVDNPEILGDQAGNIEDTEERIYKRNLVDMLARANQMEIDRIQSDFAVGTTDYEAAMMDFYRDALDRAIEEMDKPSSAPLLSAPHRHARAFLKKSSTIWGTMPLLVKDPEFRPDDQFMLYVMELMTRLFEIRHGKMQRDEILVWLTAMNASHHTTELTMSILDHGKHSAGKSKKAKDVTSLMVPGSYVMITGLTLHAWEVEGDLDHYFWVWEEAPPDKFGIDPKTGQPMAGGSEILKARMTDKIVRTRECTYIKDPQAPEDDNKKSRKQEDSISRQMGSMFVCFNYDPPVSPTGSDDEMLAIFSRFLSMAASQSFHNERSTLDAAHQKLKDGTDPAQRRCIHTFRLLHAIKIQVEMMIGAKALPDVDVTLASDFSRRLDDDMRDKGRRNIQTRTSLMFVECCREIAILSACWKWMMSDLSMKHRYDAHGAEQRTMTKEMYLDIARDLCVNASHVSQAATLMEDILDPVTRKVILQQAADILAGRREVKFRTIPSMVRGTDDDVDTNYVLVSSAGMTTFCKEIENRVGSDTMPYIKIIKEMGAMAKSVCKPWKGSRGADGISVIVLDRLRSVVSGPPKLIYVAVTQLIPYLGEDFFKKLKGANDGGDPAEGLEDEANDRDTQMKALVKRFDESVTSGVHQRAWRKMAVGISWMKKNIFSPTCDMEKALELLDNVYKATLDVPKFQSHRLWQNFAGSLLKMHTYCKKSKVAKAAKEFEKMFGAFKVITKAVLGKDELNIIMGWADFYMQRETDTAAANMLITRGLREDENKQYFVAIKRGGVDLNRQFERDTYLKRYIQRSFSHFFAQPQRLLDMAPLPTEDMRFQNLPAIIRVGPDKSHVLAYELKTTANVTNSVMLHNVAGLQGARSDESLTKVNTETSDFFYLRHCARSGLSIADAFLPSEQHKACFDLRSMHKEFFSGQITLERYPETFVQYENKRIEQRQQEIHVIRMVNSGKMSPEDPAVKELDKYGLSERLKKRCNEGMTQIHLHETKRPRIIVSGKPPPADNPYLGFLNMGQDYREPEKKNLLTLAGEKKKEN